MSSNAFARSRPRVRHQRVPRIHCYAHPRFLQLVKEIARLDEVKKKQEEAEGHVGDDTSRADESGVDCSNNRCCNDTGDRLNKNVPLIAADYVYSTTSSHSINNTNNTCCNSTSNDAQTASNDYRSLNSNQSTSALHDNYYRQSNNSNSSHPYHSHHHQHLYHLNQNHYQSHNSHLNNDHYHLNHHQELGQLSNNNNSQQCRQDTERCPNKCNVSSSSSTSGASFGYSKQGLVEQGNLEFLGNELDLRQDENRSKRKRSSNDTLMSNPKKIPSSSSSLTGSKRHKSSPEPTRPLSPSFTKCPICLLDCMDRDPSFTNTCFHLFCFVCIDSWTKNKATCPLCRTKFTKIIYNIRSASCYEEKNANPARRDEDDDRIIYEQLQGLNTNPILPSRTSNTDEQRSLFDNLRNGDVLMPPFPFVNQIDPRQVDPLHSFNSVTTTNFNSGVPQPSFTNYSPIGSNYIALIPSNNRIQQPASTAISSAYTSTGLSNISNDPGNRPRISRSARFVYSRSYDLPSIESSARMSRATNTGLNQHVIPLERQHQHDHQQSSHHSHHQHRTSTVLTVEAHPHLHMSYQIAPRHHNPGAYSRRPYANPPIEQHLLDNLYRQMPDM